MPALTNEVYFCGYHPEHFTGWGGQGKSVYASFVNSDSVEPHGIGYTLIDNSVANQTWGYGCLWGPFADNLGAPTTLNDFFVGAELNLWNPYCVYRNAWGAYNMNLSITEADGLQYAPLVLHCTGGYLVLKVRPGASNSPNSGYAMITMYLATDLNDFSTYTDLNMQFNMIPNGNVDVYPTGNAPPLVSISVSGAGTSSGKIYAKITNIDFNNSNAVTEQTWTGDLTQFSDFSAISFHSFGPSTLAISPSGNDAGFYSAVNAGSRVYFCFVTNFDTRDAYLDYSYATTAGTETGWSGDLTTFSTFPTNYFGFGGLYATAAGQTETLKFNAAFTPDVGLEPKVLIASSGAVTDSASTVAEVALCIKDPTTGNIVNGAPVTVNDLGQEQKWIFSTDILKNASWTTANINSYEFGLTRTK